MTATVIRLSGMSDETRAAFDRAMDAVEAYMTPIVTDREEESRLRRYRWLLECARQDDPGEYRARRRHPRRGRRTCWPA